MIGFLSKPPIRSTAVSRTVLVLALSLPAVSYAELSARVTVPTASLFVHEPFSLSLDVESELPPETPELPAVPDLAVTAIRRLPSDPARREHTFRIGVIAERDGILTIPPFVVRAGGETALTSALRLQIRSPRPATEMALKIEVEPVALRVGQPATVTATWTSRAAFERCKQLLFHIPLLTDPRLHVYPLDPREDDAMEDRGPTTPAARESEFERLPVPVNNIRVFARMLKLAGGQQTLSLRYTVVPRVPCVLRAPPAQLACALLEDAPPSGQSASYFYNHFFDSAGEEEAFEQVYLTAAVPELTVRALPETGRTAHFANIVGPCDIRVSVAPTRLVAGQPALLTVELEGLAEPRHIGELPSAAFAGLHAEFQLSETPIRESSTGHARSFTHTLRPLQPGLTRVPAIVIQTFDPDSGRYRTLRSTPVPVSVAADPEAAVDTLRPRIDARTPIRLHGVRHNRIDEQMMMPAHDLFRFLGQFWWIFVPLPPLLWLAVLPLARRWERCRRDPVYARAVGAWWRFRRAALRDEEEAWRNYLADRLGLCAEALTADTVTEALRSRAVDADLITESRRCFEQRDAVEYGRQPVASSGGTYRLVRKLQRATMPLLLVASLLGPLRVDAAESAEELFTLAMRMREEKPDEAQPLFTEAALGFEAAEHFLNAGNSWFFAGENGRALANYRAAQRRAPFDRQVRESIQFLRNNRPDAFPIPTAAGSLVSSNWNRYCAWTPRLRLGTFVLAYLLTWAVFLTAQLTGWRVHRTVWAVLLLAVVVPLLSLVQTSFQPAEGVVIEDTLARLGPGYAYDPAFEKPLHEAAEFAWLETRDGWVRARFPDASEGWLRETGCIKVE